MAKITAVTLDLTGSKTRRQLGSKERIHAIVERSLGPADGRDPNGIRNQWRLDDDVLFIVSQGTPDERTLREQFDILDFKSKSYDGLLDSLKSDTRWLFRVDANASYVVGGKYHSARGEDEVFAWLDRQGTKAGFHITRDRLGRPEARISQRPEEFHKKNGNRVVMVSTIVNGFLSIDNPEKFRTALIQGIGRGKAYGHGLITLAPAKTSEQ